MGMTFGFVGMTPGLGEMASAIVVRIFAAQQLVSA